MENSSQLTLPTLKLNGSQYVKFPVNDSLYTDDIFLSIDLSLTNWNTATSTQIIGNYNDEQGFGIFIENGMRDVDSFRVFDITNAHWLYLNGQGGLISQRGLPTTMQSTDPNVGSDTPKPNKSRITAFTTDVSGKYYVYDESNNVISVFTNENIIIDEFYTPSSDSVISSMWCDEFGGLHVLDTLSRVGEFDEAGDPLPDVTPSIFRYDEVTGTFNEVLGALGHPSHNNFTFMPNGSIQSFISTPNSLMLSDANNNFYNQFGVNLYKNGIPWFFVGSLFNTYGIDVDDNIWIIYNNNRVLKISPLGTPLFNKTFHQFRSCGSVTCDVNKSDVVGISFVTETIDGVVVASPWVILGGSEYAIKLDPQTGASVSCLLTTNLMDTTSFEDLDITHMNLCVNGDSSGFYAKKMFDSLEGNTQIITRMVTTKNEHVELVALSHPTLGVSSGRHNISFAYEGGSGYYRMTFDGVEVGSGYSHGVIRYKEGTPPPLLIGAESGKARSKKEEIGITNPRFLVGEFFSIVIGQDGKHTPADIPKLRSINIEAALGDGHINSYSEVFDKMFLMRHTGVRSNRYNMLVKNTGILDPDVQNMVEDDIALIAQRVTPMHVRPNKVEWVEDVTIGKMLVTSSPPSTPVPDEPEIEPVVPTAPSNPSSEPIFTNTNTNTVYDGNINIVYDTMLEFGDQLGSDEDEKATYNILLQFDIFPDNNIYKFELVDDNGAGDITMMSPNTSNFSIGMDAVGEHVCLFVDGRWIKTLGLVVDSQRYYQIIRNYDGWIDIWSGSDITSHDAPIKLHSFETARPVSNSRLSLSFYHEGVKQQTTPKMFRVVDDSSVYPPIDEDRYSTTLGAYFWNVSD